MADFMFNVVRISIPKTARKYKEIVSLHIHVVSSYHQQAVS